MSVVGDVKPVPAREKTARPDASPEVEVSGDRSALASEIHREHNRQWSIVRGTSVCHHISSKR